MSVGIIYQSENTFLARFLVLMWLFAYVRTCTDGEFECMNSIMQICTKDGFWITVECPANAICSRDAGFISCSIRPTRTREKNVDMVDGVIKPKPETAEAFYNKLDQDVDSDYIKASYGQMTRIKRNTRIVNAMRSLQIKQNGMDDAGRLYHKSFKPESTVIVTPQVFNYGFLTPSPPGRNSVVYLLDINDSQSTRNPYVPGQNFKHAFGTILGSTNANSGLLQQSDSIQKRFTLQPSNLQQSSHSSFQEPGGLEITQNFFYASQANISSSVDQIVTVAQLTNAMKTQGYNPNENYLNAVVQGANKHFKDKEMAAMFLAQIAYESGGYVHTEEIACKSTGCPGRYGMGAPGKSYHGRGFIQLSWPGNYKSASKDLGMGDKLYQTPEMVAEDADLAMKVSIWYWNKRVAPVLGVSQNKQFGLTTKLINGVLECRNNANIGTSKKRYQIYKAIAKEMGVTNLASESGCYTV